MESNGWERFAQNHPLSQEISTMSHKHYGYDFFSTETRPRKTLCVMAVISLLLTLSSVQGQENTDSDVSSEAIPTLQLKDLIHPEPHGSSPNDDKDVEHSETPDPPESGAEELESDLESLLKELESEDDSSSKPKEDPHDSAERSREVGSSGPSGSNSSIPLLSALKRLHTPMADLRLSSGLEEGGESEEKEDKRPVNLAGQLFSETTPRILGGLGFVGGPGNEFSGYLVAVPRFTAGPVFCHRPLFFEQVDLERCGNGRGCSQNVLSFTRFLSDTLTLPIRGLHRSPHCLIANGPPCKCGQTLRSR